MTTIGSALLFSDISINKQSQNTNTWKLIAYNEGAYFSRYFDYQKAYRYVGILHDGNQIETTAYEHYLSNIPTTLAIDISTMVGCPMRCKFCAASMIEYKRILSVKEIVSQVLFILKERQNSQFKKITCSFQGIGEPSLMPYEIIKASSVIRSIDDRIVISIATTATNPNAISIFGQCGIDIENLQLSCSATTICQSIKLMSKSMEPSIITNIATSALKYRSIKKIKLNYILFKDFNDSFDDANRLIKMIGGRNILVKISLLNSTSGSKQTGLVPASARGANMFCKRLHECGVDSYVYGSVRKIEISCGQLLSMSATRR